MKDVLDLEKQAWKALTMGKDKAKKYYQSVLRDDAVMIFPGGMRISGRDNILKSFSSQPWASYQIIDPGLISISDDVKMIIYQVMAKRLDSDPYQALISSTYVQSDDSWKMVHHQQSQK